MVAGTGNPDCIRRSTLPLRSPAIDSGDLINSEQDIDAAQEGYQIDVRVKGNSISSGASFAVCTTALQGPADASTWVYQAR